MKAILLSMALATATLACAQAPSDPTSAAIPIKELTPPPPNQFEGKSLISGGSPSPSGITFPDIAAEHEWVFKDRDANGDSKLSKEEFPERLRPAFALADTNKDGFLSLPEFLTQRLSGKPLAFADISYADSDNPRQQLDLYLPLNIRSDKPLPLIVFIHGGGWQKGSKAGGRELLSRFIQTGNYAAASIGYRLTDEARWPAQLHDCKAAIRWLKAHAQEYYIDPAKIGVWGTSAGGHLAALLGTTGDVKELEGALGKHLDQDSRVACVVNYFGPANFLTLVTQPSSIDRGVDAQYPEALLLGGPVQKQEALAKEASPVTHVSAGDAPFFTAHGTLDPLVPFAQAQELHSALQRAGVPSILQEISNGVHGFKSVDLDQRVTRYFDRHLRGSGSGPESAPIVFPVPKEKAASR
jgi:acetyl esterase/lipase